MVSVFSLIDFPHVNMPGILTRKVLSVREMNFDITCFLLTCAVREMIEVGQL
jgi:hypothetical protein